MTYYITSIASPYDGSADPQDFLSFEAGWENRYPTAEAAYQDLVARFRGADHLGVAPVFAVFRGQDAGLPHVGGPITSKDFEAFDPEDA